MKKYKILFGILAILAIAFFGKSLFAGSMLAAGPILLADIDTSKQQDLSLAIANAMKRENPTGLGRYVGENNKAIYFHGGGANSFMDEKYNTAEFGLRLVNSTASMKRIVLCPGYFNTFGLLKQTVQCPAITTQVVSVLVNGAPTNLTVISAIAQNAVQVVVGYILHDTAAINNNGFNVDAVIDDDTILIDSDKSVICSSLSRGSVQDFIKYVTKNPTRVVQMTIASNNVSQYNRKITVKPLNPSGDFGEHYIQLKNFFDINQERDEKIIVDTDKYNLQFGDQALIIFELDAAVSPLVPTVTDITMTLGAGLNIYSELHEESVQAKAIIKQASLNLPLPK